LECSMQCCEPRQTRWRRARCRRRRWPPASAAGGCPRTPRRPWRSTPGSLTPWRTRTELATPSAACCDADITPRHWSPVAAMLLSPKTPRLIGGTTCHSTGIAGMAISLVTHPSGICFTSGAIHAVQRWAMPGDAAGQLGEALVQRQQLAEGGEALRDHARQVAHVVHQRALPRHARASSTKSVLTCLGRTSSGLAQIKSSGLAQGYSARPLKLPRTGGTDG